MKLIGILCILTPFTAISQVTANQPQDLFTCDINNPGDGDIFTDPNLSVQEETLPVIKIYPNPISFVMTLENIDLNATIIIYDTLGRTVRSFINDQTNTYTIDV